MSIQANIKLFQKVIGTNEYPNIEFFGSKDLTKGHTCYIYGADGEITSSANFIIYSDPFDAFKSAYDCLTNKG